jgi:hypothetical protein
MPQVVPDGSLRLADLHEILPPAKYKRCIDPRLAAYFFVVSLICLFVNISFIIGGELGLLPSYDYQLFGYEYPSLYGSIVAMVAHRTYTLRSYGTSGALERLTSICLPECQLRRNRLAVQFCDNVLGTNFGLLALLQSPVYAYLAAQRVEFDGVCVFYTVYLVSGLLQGHLLLTFCAVYDNLYVWVVPTYLKAHIDKMAETVEKILQEGEKPIRQGGEDICDAGEALLAQPQDKGQMGAVELSALNRLDLALDSLRALIEETNSKLGAHQNVVSFVQSIGAIVVIPLALENFEKSEDRLSTVCAWVLMVFAVSLLMLEAAQMYFAAQVRDHYDHVILRFNAAKYAAVERRLLGRQGSLYKLLLNLFPAIGIHVAGVPLCAQTLGNFMEGIKFALLLSIFYRMGMA